MTLEVNHGTKEIEVFTVNAYEIYDFLQRLDVDLREYKVIQYRPDEFRSAAELFAFNNSKPHQRGL